MLPDTNYTRDNTAKYSGESQDNPQTVGPVKALREAIALLTKKGQDYQNPNSSIKHADHYRRGIDTLHDSLHGKIRRAQSLIESGSVPNNESLLDSYMDIIAYAAFCVAWLRKEIDGQDKAKDMFNKPIYDITTAPITTLTGAVAHDPKKVYNSYNTKSPEFGSDGLSHL